MLNVLVVDDEQILLKVLERLLKAHSYEVRTATNVPAALTLAQQARPDVLVTDFNLNDSQDGLDLCRAFAQDAELARTCRIIISGQASQLTGKGILFDSFLAKPFTSQEFLKVLEQVVAPLLSEDNLLTRYDSPH